MRIRLNIPSHLVSAPLLNAVLEAGTQINEAILHAHPDLPNLHDAGVRWQPEPPGDECWDDAIEVIRRGWGDCDDLGMWRAAERRVRLGDAGARAIAYRSGPRLWHAVTLTGDGYIDDPSLALGMRAHRGIRIPGAPAPAAMMNGIAPEQWSRFLRNVVTEENMQIRWRAYRCGNGWCGEIDVPIGDQQFMTIRELGSHQGEALHNALQGAADVCGSLDSVGFFGELLQFVPALVSTAASVAENIAQQFAHPRGRSREQLHGEAHEVVGQLGTGSPLASLASTLIPSFLGLATSLIPGGGGGGGAAPQPQPKPAAPPAAPPAYGGGGYAFPMPMPPAFPMPYGYAPAVPARW